MGRQLDVMEAPREIKLVTQFMTPLEIALDVFEKMIVEDQEMKIELDVMTEEIEDDTDVIEESIPRHRNKTNNIFILYELVLMEPCEACRNKNVKA